MLISKEKNFLFFHVYKVAGTSIREVLRPYCSFRQVALQNLNYATSIFGVKLPSAPINNFHPNLRDVRDYMGDLFYSYYRFSFVRHPLDWQKSLYFFMRKNRRHHQHNIVEGKSFEEYLKWRINEDRHLMIDLISDNNGDVLVNDIYRFEEIDSEFRRLCARININASLPHKNLAGFGNRVEVSPETLYEFKQAFSRDYEFFGYS
uniref:sulfotransferase family 2 domain-containing protein n=1 Tax=Microbulbifer agarilyticus TaxID=260552 RepID=UPI000524DBA8|nr:sulfotransferase family 2 domain-containing protein [Microbulbifer agarilyticus]